jgi:hypothetical protein
MKKTVLKSCRSIESGIQARKHTKVRLHACGQGLEVITAFQATDQASLSVLICNRHQLRGHPRVIGLNQTHLTEVIEPMGIKASAN